MQPNETRLCGLWHAHVVNSTHNDNGKCDCIGCPGGHCHTCSQYRALVDRVQDIFAKTVCQLCQEHQPKTK
ncbi:MAG: hypothetical protein K2L95_05035 [Alphaproteobacteria bacterium]|nr:hypothetical protein [Alphaproteobacteria bacterium]